MVEAEQATDPLGLHHRASLLCRAFVREEQDVADSLMIALGMVVRQVLAQHVTQRLFAKEDESVQTLALDRLHPTFGKGVWTKY